MWYHLIGISGVSMRSIGKILERQGNKVTGSDLKITGHSKDNIKTGVEAVVYTSAVTEDSPGWVEIEEAKKQGIPLIKRGEMLAKIVENKKVIAVSGTHGKTTTTAMIGLSLIKAGLDPLVIVGEEVPELGGTTYFGTGEYAVIEACEYDRNFLYLHPDIAVVTNIEEEHLDHYPGGLPDIIATFKKFSLQIKDGGTLVFCGDDKNASDMGSSVESKNISKITYGLDKGNQVNDLSFELQIPGDHNRRNALAAIAVSNAVGIEATIVEKAIESFRGAHRRFEILGEKDGVLVIDDYGHHPTEIKAVLSGLKEKYSDKKIFAVFWPHQFKRTLALLPKFKDAFSLVDNMIIKEIFFVPGRDEKLDISGADIVDLINEDGKNRAVFIDDDEKIIEYLNANLNSDYVLATIGIPPVYKIAKEYLGERC